MSLLYRWFCKCLALALGVLIVLPLTAHAQVTRLPLESVCDRDTVFANGRPIDVDWQPFLGNVAKIPIQKTCWLRITRPGPSADSGNANREGAADQFLVFENSWGSDFVLYGSGGERLAESSVAGKRYRVFVDRIWVYFPLAADSPGTLYAKVTSLHHTSEVRHSVYQVNSAQILRDQKKLFHGAAGWLLFGAAAFSLLFFVVQRNKHYALFSGFALVFALTSFSDKGDLVVWGLTASSDFLSLSYPLSGLALAWLALEVGQFSRHTPWVARVIQLVIALYGSLALWQLSIVLGMPLPTAPLEPFSEFVYNTAAVLQLLVLWSSFRTWQRGDKTGMLLAIAVAPLILFEIQISDWFAEWAPTLSKQITLALGSSLRVTSYLVLPLMFFAAIAYRAQKAQADAIRLAQQDHLTNLPNRDHFLHLGDAQLRARKGTVLVAIHIDRLQAINSVLGFQVGDAVIVEVGRRLTEVGASVVARVQTTQFCLLLDDKDTLPAVRQQINAAFAKPVFVLGQTLDVSLSIGVAHNTGEGISHLMRDAEIAQSVAKSTKVNWLVYELAMDTTRPESLSLLSELNRAIVQSELRLYLQPKVDLKSGRIVGAEALVRWQHPTRGMVPPNDFIPFAEQTGKIGALTLWVVNEGARLIALWRTQGRPLVVSVNISTFDLRDPLFVGHVTTIVKDQAALPGDLRLEVTESGMMDDPEASLAALNALRDAGFSLSIDDFGTGYSSLSYLQRMPVAELKIDRSFVSNVKAGSDGAALLDSIITLGHRMGLNVVAEGAETAQECAVLKGLGCDSVQGWFVAKAMPVADFDTWRHSNDPFVLPDEADPSAGA